MAVAANAARERDLVYPEERLPWPQTLIMGFQHVMAMFGGTVLVPLILGFNPNTVIFFGGIGALIFIAIAGVIYFLVGVVVQFAGINFIRFLFPPVVTGTVIGVVG